MTFQSSFQSHSQLGSNLHYISFWGGVNFICTLQSHFLEASDFLMGKVTVLSLCSVEKTGLFLRIPTTLKNSEIMAIFPSLCLLFLFLYWVFLCPVSLYRFCSLLFHSEIIMCLCIYVPLVLVYKLSRQFYSLAYCQS